MNRWSYYSSILLFLFLNTSFAQWVHVNGPAGGNIHSLTAAGNYIFACAGNGNIYRSSDYGENWKELNKAPMKAGTRLLSTHENTIFAGSYQYIYRSTDLGNTWVRCNFDKGVRCFAYMGSIIFIAAQIDGLFKSTDNGISFIKVNDPLYNDANFVAVKDSLLFSVSDEKVFVSFDMGNTWVLSFTSDPDTHIYNLCVLGENIIVNDYPKLYSSSDNGSTWSVLPISYANKIDVAGEYIFATGVNSGINKSSDFGFTWIPVSSGINSYYGINIIKAGNIFFAGNHYEGLFRSLDNGNHWIECNKNIFSTTITSFCKSSSGLWCMMPGKGIYRSSNSGIDWIFVRYLPQWRSSLIVFQDKILYTAGVTIYATSDNGNTWSIFSTAPYEWYFWKLAVRGNILFAELFDDAHQRIVYSTDSGVSWKNTWEYSSHVTTWASNANYMFAAFEDEYPPYPDYICRLDEADRTWKLLNNGFQTSYPKTIALSGSDIFAGSLDGGVYISENDGELWKQVPYPFPSSGSHVFSVNDHFVLSNSFGSEGRRILLYEKSSAAWKDVTQSFIEPDIITTIENDGNLFAALNGEGIWMLPLTSASANEVKTLPGENALEQNYPNPFNPLTRISYSLAEEAYVTIDLFTTTGEKAAQLVNEQKAAGYYSAYLNAGARNLASGVYFYRMTAVQYQGKTFTSVKKLIVLK